MKIYRAFLVISVLCLCCLGAVPAMGRAQFTPLAIVDKSSGGEVSVFYADQPRRIVLHDAGIFYSPIIDGIFSRTGMTDPETGEFVTNATYPIGSENIYVFWGALWVGGIVNEDTLVSVGIDGWITAYELPPEDPVWGSSRRTGQFADDEFVTVLADTGSQIQSPLGHTPLGLQVRLKSYSWADSVYDDFIILDYTVRNIGPDDIREGWVGFYFDDDIYHESQMFYGFSDDISGLLDTLLYDDDPFSRILIPYAYDNDGDPDVSGMWAATSVRGVAALMPLGASFPVETANFNYWFSNGIAALDWGPRRLGTPEDPLRIFSQSNLGTPVIDVDKYYIMSHPEIDYDQIEIAIHDSSDGWIPPTPQQGVDWTDGYDTRYLYSYGPFDLSSGDSISFAVAVVMADGFHVNPRDWVDYFDPLIPQIYRETFDYSELMVHCRRADSVYRSGYTLPHPGPPVGLKITGYDDSFISLAWHGSDRPDLAGYYIYIKDTVYSSHWSRVTGLLSDTATTISVYEPTHTYWVAVSLRDTLGRESAPSFSVTAVTGIPHPPRNLTINLDGLVPLLSWEPSDDTTLQVFRIYRAIWDSDFLLYDSTTSLIYRDYGTESGVRYSYMVSSFNVLDLESDIIGPVTALPMALDKGILYCNMNRFANSSPPPYSVVYFERMFESVASLTQTDLLNIDDGEISFKTLADYTVIIIDQGGVPKTLSIPDDSLRNYLAGGGRAVLIKPAFQNIGPIIKKSYYPPGSFYHDVLKLDSAVTNALMISGGAIVGDLYACQPLQQDYPWLYADTVKIAEAIYDMTGYIPLSGYIFPTAEADPIYSYVSSNPDTVHQGCINGIRYLSDDYGFVMLNFPLLAIREQANLRALNQALVDLGVDMDCGDANGDGMTNIGDAICLISYLYRGGPEPSNQSHADTDCSGDIETADAMSLINYIFKNGWLDCCR